MAILPTSAVSPVLGGAMQGAAGVHRKSTSCVYTGVAASHRFSPVSENVV